MIVAGVMSGTSADGINVALVRLLGKGMNTRLTLLAHDEFRYPQTVRRAVLAMMAAKLAPVADLARLDFLLAELYAEAVLQTARRNRLEPQLVGCHGQTIYHQGDTQRFLGRPLAVTWQTGDGSVLAAKVGVPVVCDFRPADMAAGGKGAPLVPYLDYLIYRDRKRGRILQNLGGIGNLTAIPANAKLEQVVAFDTGPGNMVIDACMERLFRKRYDTGGLIAARGKADEDVVRKFLAEPYFRRKPPKTAGREEYGHSYVQRLLMACRGIKKEDTVATATALTARSIGMGLRRFVIERGRFHEYVVAGGGAKNRTLLRMIDEQITPLGLKLRHSDEFGIPAAAKEAVAFAVLAYQTWQRQPGNIPSATGAERSAILGKICYA